MKIELRQTCGACPEQYDAYVGETMVGYLRLRHGAFSVTCPDASGEDVYIIAPNDDGIFDDDERDKYLTYAKAVIYQWLDKTDYLKDKDR